MNHEPELPDELVDLLPLWIGGDLDEDVADRVAQAVADSEELATRAEELAAARAALVDGLHSSVELDPAPDLWPGVESALVAEGILPGAERTVAPAAAPAGRVLSFRDARPRSIERVAVAALVLVGSALAWKSFAGGEVDPSPAGERTTIENLAADLTPGGPAVETVASETPQATGPDGLVPLGDRPSLRDGDRPLLFLNHARPAGGSNGTATLASDVR